MIKCPSCSGDVDAVPQAEFDARLASMREGRDALKDELTQMQATLADARKRAEQYDSVNAELQAIRQRGSEDEALRAAGIDPSVLADRHRAYVRSLLDEARANDAEMDLAGLLGSDAAKADPLLGGLLGKAPPAGSGSSAQPPPPGATPPARTQHARTDTPRPEPKPAAEQAQQLWNQSAGLPLAERLAQMESAHKTITGAA